jgi:hypothetical protein
MGGAFCIPFWTMLAGWAQVVVLIVTARFVWRYLRETERLRTAAQEQVEASQRQVTASYEQLRAVREQNKVQHLVRFIEQFESEPMATYRKLTAEKRHRGTAYPPEAQRILDFFETIGLLVKREYLDVLDVWACFSYWMFNVYADFREDIAQEQKDDPSYYEDFVALVERLRKVEVERGGTDDRPSREDIRDFWADETKLVAGAPARRTRTRRTRDTTIGEDSKAKG